VELLGTRLGWYSPQLQGGYALMDLINRGYFLFFRAFPSPRPVLTFIFSPGTGARRFEGLRFDRDRRRTKSWIVLIET
jgi:hypothetical protein